MSILIAIVFGVLWPAAGIIQGIYVWQWKFNEPLPVAVAFLSDIGGPIIGLQHLANL